MVVHNPNAILLHGLLSCFIISSAICCTGHEPSLTHPRNEGRSNLTAWQKQIVEYVNETLSVDRYNISESIVIEPTAHNPERKEVGCAASRSLPTWMDIVREKYDEYARTHILSIKPPGIARFFVPGGKSSFLTGFGMGFLAFGLKKLLLPIFIVSQIVKSVLIAMFLPSILGSLGKLVGKGLSQVSSVSGASSSGHQQPPLEDFDFKDMDAYNADNSHDFGTITDPNDSQGSSAGIAEQTNSRFGQDYYNKVSYTPANSDNYYIKKPNKPYDYKVFHKIPSSSLLLTTYDPFYSPLLSRLDSVFQQLGLGNGKGPLIERCREKLVCLMYANPAKYAPYSNLVSTQLSRELNELRKPSSDNPEILRFFRYMKAAKDGQDGEHCTAYVGCPSLQAAKPSPAMLTTYNDINKLVQARRLR